MSLTVLVDYDAGNLHSAQKAFERMARDVGSGEVLVSNRPEDVARADRIVLPGDGAFPACRRALQTVPGLEQAIDEAVTRRGVPFLGICVGMQMLATWGREYQDVQGFDWIGGEVVRIQPANRALKVPHMGWNDLVIDPQVSGPHPVLAGIRTGDHAYFVHSYQFRVTQSAHRLAHVDYAGDVTAIVGRTISSAPSSTPRKAKPPACG